MQTPTYVYFMNYPEYEQELCEMELRYLFGSPQPAKQKHRFSTQKIAANRSPFFRQRVEVSFQATTLAELVQAVQAAALHADEFKIHYLKTETDERGYQERVQACREVGFVIGGEANMQAPKVNFGLACLDGQWLFGEMEQHDAKWQTRTEKPHSYSNSLNNKVAKVAVNIACAQRENPRLIDPCCGVGTVVIEALAQGIDIVGCEINPSVAHQAKANVAHFELADHIQVGDMHELTGTYDVAIIDIPYGLYTPTTTEDQLAILTTAKRLAPTLVLLTSEDLTPLLQQAGYTTIDTCPVHKKNTFTRYLCVCN